MSLAEKPAHKAIGERPLGGQRGRCVFVARNCQLSSSNCVDSFNPCAVEVDGIEDEVCTEGI